MTQPGLRKSKATKVNDKDGAQLKTTVLNRGKSAIRGAHQRA